MYLLKIGPLLLAAVFADCQVEVTVSALAFNASEQIDAKVVNAGHQQISYCIQIGQTSVKGPRREVEATPMPFSVQSKTGHKWSTLLIGPDVGNFLTARVLDPSQSDEFLFRLPDKGEMRLVLSYWIGERKQPNCKNPPEGRKEARSKAFLVH
jgi:hypothetical protein